MYEGCEQAVVESQLPSDDAEGCETFVSVPITDWIGLHWKVNYWESQFIQSKEREQQ